LCAIRENIVQRCTSVWYWHNILLLLIIIVFFPPMENDKQLAHRRHDIVSWTLSSSRSVTGRTWCIIYKLRRRRRRRRRRPPYELFYFWCCLQGRRKRETMTVWLPILSRSITLTISLSLSLYLSLPFSLSLYLSVTHFMYTILRILFHYPITNHVGGANRDSIRTLLYSFIPI